jgi:hypothetical protein
MRIRPSSLYSEGPVSRQPEITVVAGGDIIDVPDAGDRAAV